MAEIPSSMLCLNGVRARNRPTRNAPVMAAMPPNTSADQAYSRQSTSVRASSPLLICRRLTWGSRRGSSNMPTAEAASRYPRMRRTVPAMLTSPPLPVTRARDTERMRMTRMSSKTAAPSSASPTRLRSTPNSSSVWAEMLTLVADKARPMNSASENSRPNSMAVPMPRASGRKTPKTPATADTLPAPSSSARCSSSPANSIRRMTPSSASRVMDSERWGVAAKTGQLWSMSSTVGPNSRPASSSPRTEGCPNRLLM